MATCEHCSAEFRDGRFIGPHDPSCPLRDIKLPSSPAQDKAGLFLDFWLILAPNLPAPVGEYIFHPSRLWRFDWAWPGQHIAVEVDGNAWHVKGGGGHMQDKDLEKLNEAQRLGWRVFRFSPGMLRRDPTKCITYITEALNDSTK